MTDYDLPIKAYHEGDRIEAHPATDIWMSGDRYGTVTLVGRKHVKVSMDRSGLDRWFSLNNIGKVS